MPDLAMPPNRISKCNKKTTNDGVQFLKSENFIKEKNGKEHFYPKYYLERL
jgi:hypothetical protein